MATLYAQGNQTWNGAAWDGVWNTAANGSGSNETPAAGDTLEANGKTITITGNLTAAALNTAGAGGSFNCGTDGVTITAAIGLATSASTVLTFAHNTPSVCAVVGDVLAAAVNGVRHNGSGTLNITGNATGGSATHASGAHNYSTGVINITGNATGGSATGAYGAYNASTGTINITGNVTGGGAANAHGAYNVSTGTMTITGNATGGSAASAHGADNHSTGTINITGNATGGSATGAYGADNHSTGTMIIDTAIGNGFGFTSIGLGGAAGVYNNTGRVRIKKLVFGELGQSPTVGPVLIDGDTANVCKVRLFSDGSEKTLADPSDNTGQAAETDVRYGVSYALGNRTGSAYIPAAGSVALGVPVDATTGTAVLLAASVPSVADILAGVVDGTIDVKTALKYLLAERFNSDSSDDTTKTRTLQDAAGADIATQTFATVGDTTTRTTAIL